MTRNTYAEYLTQKLNDTNGKLAYKISSELAKLKAEETYLQNALETQSRSELINYIEQDLEMERMKALNKSLNDSLRRSSTNLNLSAQLNNSTSAASNHNLINYLERDLEIEKLKLLNENLKLKTSMLSSKPLEERLDTTTLREYLMKKSLTNDSMRAHFLVHKPGEECSICSPNNVYMNTLKHSSDNLRTFLRNSIKENNVYLENSNSPVKPNVVYSNSKKFTSKAKPLTYSEYLKLFDEYEEVAKPPTYDRKFYQTAQQQTANLSSSLGRSLTRADLYDRDNQYNLEDDETVYKQNKYSNKYHEFNTSLNRMTNSKSAGNLSRSQKLRKAQHEKPWSYGKVETPHYEWTQMKMSK